MIVDGHRTIAELHAGLDDRRTPDGAPHPDMRLSIMNARAAAVIAGDIARWPLAGDQLYVDLHLGPRELPPGTHLCIGEAVIEITAQPHRGCAKFIARFGKEAMRFVNAEAGRRLNLRGVNARVVTGGTIHAGDAITTVRAGERTRSGPAG